MFWEAFFISAGDHLRYNEKLRLISFQTTPGSSFDFRIEDATDWLNDPKT